MALAGVGNPVTGSNPTGTSTTSLNYIGNHAYAYSGVIGVDNNETTLLEFTTASQSYIVGVLQFQYNLPNESDDFFYQIYFDGTIVDGISATSSSDIDYSIPRKLLVPPNTLLKVTAENKEGASTRDQIVHFVGRVYG